MDINTIAIHKNNNLSRIKRELLDSETFDVIKKNILSFKVVGNKRITTDGRKNRAKVPRRKWKRLTYSQYMESALWTRRKNLFFQRYTRECRACGSCEHIHLHHAKYGHYGEEKDKHLIPLCGRCHEAFHRRYKTRADMIKQTRKFVAFKRMKTANK